MRKRIIAIIVCACIFVLVIVLMVILYNRNQMKNKIDVTSLKGVTIIDLEPIEYVELPSVLDNGAALTATGISYNTNEDVFFIGNYGKATIDDSQFYPSIISMTQGFSCINNVLHFDVGSIDVQGIAYDETNDSFWYTNGDSVINCSASNTRELSRFSLGKYSRYKANGICIDTNDGSLWILCMYKYLLHYDKEGILKSVFDCGYIGQDHICMDSEGLLYISSGVDYHGDNNYVICIDKEANIKTIYRVKGSYAIEGILVLQNSLYVVNDGLYHDAEIRNNYIQIYNIP